MNHSRRVDFKRLGCPIGAATMFLAFVATLAISSGNAALGGDKPETPLDFNRDVRPILSESCFACHGPDNAKRKAELGY